MSLKNKRKISKLCSVALPRPLIMDRSIILRVTVSRIKWNRLKNYIKRSSKREYSNPVKKFSLMRSK